MKSMYRTILVPLDGSPFAEHALPMALTIARAASASLRLVRVHVPVTSTGIDIDAPARDAENAYLQDLSTRIGKLGPVPMQAGLVDGRTADALLDHAVNVHADLVVMATHGRGPVSRWWLGSVADELVRRSPLPILLVGPGESAPDLSHSPVLRHLLIPLDGSALAEEILEPALALAQLLHADVTLLRVIEPIILPDARLGGNAASGIDAGLMEALHQEARSYLDRIAESLRARQPSVQTRIISNRWVTSAIIDSASGTDQLIALTTRGRSGLARLLLGSVADKVVRGATVPVLVYRPRHDATK
jgi:nucleotide-binding universal stress UspA family protein